MQFLSKNLSVEIYDESKLIGTIKVFDARNPIISYQLDIARIKTSTVAKEYEVFASSNQDKINANDPSILERLITLSSKVRDANIDYLRECIVDYKDQIDILKSIPGSEFPDLQSAIMRAQFGIVDDPDKKKLPAAPPPTTKLNSGRGVTRKRKSRN